MLSMSLLSVKRYGLEVNSSAKILPLPSNDSMKEGYYTEGSLQMGEW